MSRIVARGALGLILLADNSASEAVAELSPYLNTFDELARTSTLVIGVGRLVEGPARIDDCVGALQARGLRLPVFAVDVRRHNDVLLLLEADASSHF